MFPIEMRQECPFHEPWAEDNSISLLIGHPNGGDDEHRDCDHEP